MGGHDITTWSILQQYFSSPLPILLYVMGWHELLHGYIWLQYVTMLQMVTVCYSHRYTGLPKSTPNVKCPRLRLYVLEASREGQEKVVEQVGALGRPGTPWHPLGGPGVLNLSARQSQMLPDPDPEARRVACAVLSFVTSGDIR